MHSHTNTYSYSYSYEKMHVFGLALTQRCICGLHKKMQMRKKNQKTENKNWRVANKTTTK
uniref:Uncharacterized protein n=1 Tax=Anguilla anguilla TaxID=7936 RepID=A0A0E9WRH9_ANGAN